jgi:hypothetical protein
MIFRPGYSSSSKLSIKAKFSIFRLKSISGLATIC